MTKSAHGRKYATGHLDQDDRLVQVSKGVYASGAVLENEFTVNYSYDSMGRMLRRDNGSEVTTFVWDGWDLLSEETDSVVTTYLVPDGLVWSFSRGEDVFQVHSDALGSVRVVTDSEGDVVARFEYGAWGELLPGSFDDVGLALCFVGGLGVRTDLETGLLYMRHRWYDAELQRFISRDPAVSGIKAAQDTITPSRGPLLANLNLYGKNNPTGFVDPTGLVPDPGPFSPPPDKIEELRRLRNPTCKIPHARHHICNALYGACWAWCLEFAITSPMNDDCIEGCYALYENCMKSGSWPTTRPWLWKQFKQPRSLPRNWLVWPFKWKWPWS